MRLRRSSRAPRKAVLTVGSALRMRVEDADRNAKLFVDDANGFGEIGIIRDHHKLIAVLSESINEHVRRDIHVRAFLLDLHHLDHIRGRIRVAHSRFAFQEVPIVNADVRERFERANERLLTAGHVWIGRRTFDTRREIANPVDAKARKNLYAELGDIEPFVRRALHGTVIQIEAVDVDVRANAEAPRMSKAALRRLAPSLRRLRGDA